MFEKQINFKEKIDKLIESTRPKNRNKNEEKDKNGENVPHLEVIEILLVYCNVVNNDYQQASKVLYTFVPNKSFR